MIKREESRHDLAFMAGVIIGAISGALAALAFAPMSGAETRQKVRESADSLTPIKEKLSGAVNAVAGAEGETTGAAGAGGQVKEKITTSASAFVATSKEKATEAANAVGPIKDKVATSASHAVATSKEKATEAASAAGQAVATGKEKVASSASHAVATSKEKAAEAANAVGPVKDKAAEIAAKSPLPVGRKAAEQDVVVSEGTVAPQPDGSASDKIGEHAQDPAEGGGA